jgi:hypothetical protein
MVIDIHFVRLNLGVPNAVEEQTAEVRPAEIGSNREPWHPAAMRRRAGA